MTITPDILRRLAASGMTGDQMALALELLAEASEKEANRLARQAERKRQSRACRVTVTGQSQDKARDSHASPTPSSAPLDAPLALSPDPLPTPPLNPPANSPTPHRPRVTVAELTVDHIADWLAEKRAKGRYLHHDEHFVLDQFKNYCQSKGKKYADYIAGYRNAFEWDRCQPGKSGQPAVGQSKWLTAAEQIIAEDRAAGRWTGRS